MANVEELEISSGVYKIADAEARSSIGIINTKLNAIEPLSLKKYIFLGDSYNFFGGGWLNKVVSGLGLDSSQYVNLTASGHGFTMTGTTGSWINDISSWINSHPSELTSISDVVIVGGLNDCTDAGLTQLSDAIDAFFIYVKSYLVNAKISGAFVGSAMEDSSVLGGRTNWNRSKAINIWTERFPLNGGVFLNGCQFSMHSYSYFGDDKLHPNSYGCNIIASNVINALKTGSATTSQAYTYHSVNFTGDYYTSAEDMIVSVQDGISSIDFRNLYIAEVVTYSNAQEIDLGVQNFIFGGEYPVVQAVGDCRLQSGGASTRHTFNLRIANRHLYVSLQDSATATSMTSFTGRVAFSSVHMQVPTILSL